MVFLFLGMTFSSEIVIEAAGINNKKSQSKDALAF